MQHNHTPREALFIRYRAACLDADMAYHRQLTALWTAYHRQVTEAAEAYQESLRAVWREETPHA